MNSTESILLLSSIVFGIVLVIIGSFKGPRIGLLGDKAHFNKVGLPRFLKFLGGTAFLSALIGFVTAHKIGMTLEYVGVNLLVALIMGPKFMLMRSNSPQ